MFTSVVKYIAEYITRYIPVETLYSGALVVAGVGTVVAIFQGDFWEVAFRAIVTLLLAVEVLYTDTES